MLRVRCLAICVAIAALHASRGALQESRTSWSSPRGGNPHWGSLSTSSVPLTQIDSFSISLPPGTVAIKEIAYSEDGTAIVVANGSNTAFVTAQRDGTHTVAQSGASGAIYSSPISTAGSVFFLKTGVGIARYTISGALEDSLGIPADASSSASIADTGRMYITSTDGNLLGINVLPLTLECTSSTAAQYAKIYPSLVIAVDSVYALVKTASTSEFRLVQFDSNCNVNTFVTVNGLPSTGPRCPLQYFSRRSQLYVCLDNGMAIFNLTSAGAPVYAGEFATSRTYVGYILEGGERIAAVHAPTGGSGAAVDLLDFFDALDPHIQITLSKRVAHDLAYDKDRNEIYVTLQDTFSVRAISTTSHADVGERFVATNATTPLSLSHVNVSNTIHTVVSYGRSDGNDAVLVSLGACQRGTYSGTGYNIPETCEPCDAGTSANATASTECADCLAGSFSAAGASDCTPCAAGSYQPEAGEAECILCPVDTYSSQVGAAGEAVCILCPYSDRCLGGNLCADGYTGELCGECASGYYRIGVACHACPSTSIPWESIVLVLVIVLVVLMFLKVSVNTVVITMVKLLVNLLQTLIVAIEIEIAWPSLLEDVITRFDVINLDIGRIAGPECYMVGKFDYLMRFAAMVFGVLFVYALLFAGSIYVRLRMWLGLRTATSMEAVDHAKDARLLMQKMKIRRLAFIVLMVVYLPLTQYSLNMFLCRPSESGEEVLNVDTSIKCYAGGHAALVWLAGAVLALFSVALPVWLYVYLRRHYLAGSLGDKRSKFGALHEIYRDKFVWWESCIMLRKFMLIIINFMADYHRPRVTGVAAQDAIDHAQIVSAAIVMLLYSGAAAWTSPYQERFMVFKATRFDINNLMENAGNLVGTFVLLTGVMIAFSAFSSEGEGGIATAVICVTLLCAFLLIIFLVIGRHAERIFTNKVDFEEIHERMRECEQNRDYLSAANLLVEFNQAKDEKRAALQRGLKKARAFEHKDEIEALTQAIADLTPPKIDIKARKERNDSVRLLRKGVDEYRYQVTRLVAALRARQLHEATAICDDLSSRRADLFRNQHAVESSCVEHEEYRQAYEVKMMGKQLHLAPRPSAGGTGSAPAAAPSRPLVRRLSTGTAGASVLRRFASFRARGEVEHIKAIAEREDSTSGHDKLVASAAHAVYACAMIGHFTTVRAIIAVVARSLGVDASAGDAEDGRGRADSGASAGSDSVPLRVLKPVRQVAGIASPRLEQDEEQQSTLLPWNDAPPIRASLRSLSTTSSSRSSRAGSAVPHFHGADSIENIPDSDHSDNPPPHEQETL